jgi:hypothetical protein
MIWLCNRKIPGSLWALKMCYKNKSFMIPGSCLFQMKVFGTVSLDCTVCWRLKRVASLLTCYSENSGSVCFYIYI